MVTMTIDFSAALSSLSAFVILLDQHLYGGLILKALAKTVVMGIRAWRSRVPSCQVAHAGQCLAITLREAKFRRSVRHFVRCLTKSETACCIRTAGSPWR